MHASSRIALILLGLSSIGQFAQAQSNTRTEVRLVDRPGMLDPRHQAELRQRNGWRDFAAAHTGWNVEFNALTGKPRRAFGPPIATTGATPQERAMGFITAELVRFGVPVLELAHAGTSTGGKCTFVHYTQRYEGVPVINGRVMVKLDQLGRVIAFSADVHEGINVDLQPAVGSAAAVAVASAGLSDIVSTESTGMRVLPVPGLSSVEPRPVHEVVVHTRTANTPGRFLCWVDAQNGTLLFRKDQVVQHEHGDGHDAGADVQVNGSVLVNGPLQTAQVVGLPDLRVTVNGTEQYTDGDGFLPTGVAGPVAGLFELRGRWSHVTYNNATPNFNATLQEGANTVSFDTPATVRQRTAYHSVTRIHNHVNAVLPTFDGMDIMLLTKVDVGGGDCNAFYDGASINFYAEGNGCRSLATVPDVVFHEYGHGINDKYYQDQGGSFINGAMNEGYADVWAFTLTQDPVMAAGYMLDDVNSFIRRYDEAPKVYPVDLVGEVHADGEIIAGAWWDTYRLLGNDMPLTLQLFAAAYPGLQATAFDGEEGQAFRDVLIDVLQADDDDADITNGTPHGDAIVEAFAIHGITLISNVEMVHTALLAAPQEEPIPIAATVDITFPFNTYLSGVRAFYRVNDGPAWNSVLMTNTGGSVYGASIPAQPAGSVIAYYLALEDINGQTSSVNPVGAAQADPNLPNFILVGLEVRRTEDADQVHQLGDWTEGLPADNASTGLWEQNDPMGSYGTFGDPSTIVQPENQHTPNGEFCWVTGNATSTSAAIGENDVDDGTTTLISDNIDMTGLATPVLTYWRWYVNNPPSGANPNADWWQVSISNNGGSSWVPVENSKTSDRSWRRMALRIQDYVTPTAQVRLMFQASDSLRPGENLDGGSLVEAAVDDIQLWEIGQGIGMEELDADAQLHVFPDPAHDVVNVTLTSADRRGLRMEVLDLHGRTVLVPTPASGSERQQFDVQRLAEGQYVLRVTWTGGKAEHRFSVVR